MMRLARCLRRALPTVLLLAGAGCGRDSAAPFTGCGDGLLLVTPSAVTLAVGETARLVALPTCSLGRLGITWEIADGSVAALVEAHDSAQLGLATVIGRGVGRTLVIARSVADPSHASAADVSVGPAAAVFPIPAGEADVPEATTSSNGDRT